MYYPQQSPGIAHKLANHHDQSSWPRPHHPVLGPPGTQQSAGPPPPSPGYALYTNGTVNPMQHHPHHLPMQPMQHHHHQNSLSHYPSPPNGHSHQQHVLPQGSPASVGSQIISPHWQQQLLKCEMVRSSCSAHHRARASAMASRTVAKSAIPITNPNVAKPQAEVNGSAKDSDYSDASDTSPASAKAPNHPSSTVAPISEAPRLFANRPPENTWNSLDMGGVNIKNIPPTSGLFSFKFLINLYLNHNSLTTIPPEISKLRHLELLDLSGNNLTALTPEVGMLTQLKELYFFDNHITTIPPEFGSLHQLLTIGVEGNPLDASVKSMIQKEGTAALVVFLRESCPVPAPPADRVWKRLLSPAEQDSLQSDPHSETFSVLCYNILCQKYATERLYGYTPSWALSWNYRKELILTDIINYGSDFICLQEVDMAHYEEFFLRNLKDQDYEGVYYPKSRYKTMNDVDRKQVDGCAIFYKASRFNLVEKHLIEFSAVAMQRQDFKKTDHMFNRVLGKDHIAVVCLMEDKQTGSRIIVANVHIYWDPAYRDVKLVQVALLVDQIEKIAADFAKYPPPPLSSPQVSSACANPESVPSENASSSSSTSNSTPHRPVPIYSDGSKIPLIICGDFNSVPESGVYEFLSTGSLPPNHADFMSHTYGRYTSEGLRHRLGLKSAYAASVTGELPMTNYTPSFQGVIDYVWYSTANLGCNGVLGEVDRTYLEKVVGFPNAHHPSDHVCLVAEFRVRPPREASARLLPALS